MRRRSMNLNTRGGFSVNTSVSWQVFERMRDRANQENVSVAEMGRRAIEQAYGADPVRGNVDTTAADGATEMLRKMKEKVVGTLDGETHQRLTVYARQLGRSKSSILAHAVKEYLDRHEPL